jgi:hypothetical protein
LRGADNCVLQLLIRGICCPDDFLFRPLTEQPQLTFCQRNVEYIGRATDLFRRHAQIPGDFKGKGTGAFTVRPFAYQRLFNMGVRAQIRIVLQ